MNDPYSVLNKSLLGYWECLLIFILFQMGIYMQFFYLKVTDTDTKKDWAQFVHLILVLTSQ